MHPKEPGLLVTPTPVLRTEGDVFDTLTTDNNEVYHVFKSEDFLLEQENETLKLKFSIMDSNMNFIETHLLVKDCDSCLSIPRLINRNSEKAMLSIDELEEADYHSKSCAMNVGAVLDNNLNFYKIGNEYWIPFWGYNDIGPVKSETGYYRFAFYYICNEPYFKDFMNNVKLGNIDYYTQFPFHDEPTWDTARKCWTHYSIGFPI